jgi:vacuolar-type H+-ATPase subunit E/Vma4
VSHEVLIQDLRRKSGDRIKRIRLEVEDDAEEFRRQKLEEFERRQAEVQGQLKDLAEKVAAPILHGAKRSALAIEDKALTRLSQRFYTLGAGMLAQVRQQDYEAVFAELVREVPVSAWEKVRVNPLDKEMAGSLFPGAEVEADPSITGGFLASADGGRYQVINTFESRLEKGWPTILPLLLKEIVKEQDAASVA